MRVKLEQLQKIVSNTIDQEKAAILLKNEVARALGSCVYVDCSLAEIAANANSRLDVLERTHKLNTVSFKPSVMMKLIENSEPEVRKLAARTLPERFLGNFAKDKSATVRYAVAKKIEFNSLVEMMKRTPNDDELRSIFRDRKLNEAGIPDVKRVDEPFDLHGEKLGDTVKQWEGPELSDYWYKTMAEKFMKDYNANVEYRWEEILARRYCSSVKATVGLQIDEKKLLDCIKDLIKDNEDAVLKHHGLKETIEWLKSSEQEDMMQESFMPVIQAREDSVADLVESNENNSDYITKMNKMFCIKESTIPRAIRKYRANEVSRTVQVPVIGHVPNAGVFSEAVEIALDRYCEMWNRKQAISGEPIKISWSTHPDELGKVAFSIELM
jgi:hypothetical protein